MKYVDHMKKWIDLDSEIVDLKSGEKSEQILKKIEELEQQRDKEFQTWIAEIRESQAGRKILNPKVIDNSEKTVAKDSTEGSGFLIFAVVISALLVACMMFCIGYDFASSKAESKIEKVPFGIETLNSFESVDYMEFRYFQQESWDIADRDYKMVANSPFYVPENYMCRLVLDGSTIIYASLDDVRLVWDENDSCMVRATGSADNAYVELNLEPNVLEDLKDNGMFETLNDQQIYYILQYLSDRAIDISHGDVRVPECNMPPVSEEPGEDSLEDTESEGEIPSEESTEDKSKIE